MKPKYIILGIGLTITSISVYFLGIIGTVTLYMSLVFIGFGLAIDVVIAAFWILVLIFIYYIFIRRMEPSKDPHFNKVWYTIIAIVVSSILLLHYSAEFELPGRQASNYLIEHVLEINLGAGK